MLKYLPFALKLRDKARSLTQDQRASLYKAAAVITPVALAAAVALHWLNEDEAGNVGSLILTLLGLVLGTTGLVTAKSNTPHTEKGAVVTTFKPAD